MECVNERSAESMAKRGEDSKETKSFLLSLGQSCILTSSLTIILILKIHVFNFRVLIFPQNHCSPKIGQLKAKQPNRKIMFDLKIKELYGCLAALACPVALTFAKHKRKSSKHCAPNPKNPPRQEARGWAFPPQPNSSSWAEEAANLPTRQLTASCLCTLLERCTCFPWCHLLAPRAWDQAQFCCHAAHPRGLSVGYSIPHLSLRCRSHGGGELCMHREWRRESEALLFQHLMDYLKMLWLTLHNT